MYNEITLNLRMGKLAKGQKFRIENFDFSLLSSLVGRHFCFPFFFYVRHRWPMKNPNKLQNYLTILMAIFLCSSILINLGFFKSIGFVITTNLTHNQTRFPTQEKMLCSNFSSYYLGTSLNGFFWGFQTDLWLAFETTNDFLSILQQQQ